MARLMAPEITIHNQSNETISLIPFSCHYRENPRSAFLVRRRLARNILARGHITVPREDYNIGAEVPEFQIHMLFRRLEFPEIVEPGVEEKIFLYTDLADNAEWRLSLDNGKVSGGPGHAADQTSSGANAAAQAALGANAAGTQDESLLERLREEVRQLTRQVEILQNRVADLERRLNEQNPA